MSRRYPISIQSTYADLLERTKIASLETNTELKGSYVSKNVSGRTYWYFQHYLNGKKRQKYIGPESEELLQTIEKAKVAKAKAEPSRDDRKRMVNALVQAGLPALDARIARILETLAQKGVFRLRSVLVGTNAYSCYAAILGRELPSVSIITEDVDIAQFSTISLAVEDSTEPFGDLLREVDSSFREIPDLRDRGHYSRWASDDGLRIDLLSPMVGPDDEELIDLPALNAHATPLRYLDYLIYKTMPAVVLYDAGVLVNVPEPARYACHKLVVAANRSAEHMVKAYKDLQQAEALFSILLEDATGQLEQALVDLIERGPRWRQCAAQSINRLSDEVGRSIRELAMIDYEGNQYG